MEKIKNPVIVEGLLLLFSYIFGLAIDEHIQDNIFNYPDSWQVYQWIQNILHSDNILMPFFILLWVIGTIGYIFKKIKD